ncbi:MAG: hypothetical protein AAGC55_02950 [Myxococcota bacterium]
MPLAAHSSALVAAVMTVLCAGCGLGFIDQNGGGGDNLPTQSAGPYSKLPGDVDTTANEPFILSVFQVNLVDPSALPLPDGGFRLWFGAEPNGSQRLSEIWTIDVPDLRDRVEDEPGLAVSADRPWENDWVGAPCVVEDGDGGLIMFYQGDANSPSIGRAESQDGGITWEKGDENPIITGFGQPAIGQLDDSSWVLYATRADRPGIFRGTSADGRTWTMDDQPVLLPRTEQSDAFDKLAVSNPWLVVRSTSTGIAHQSLFFNGLDDADSTSVGWAGSFDGRNWSRFANPDDAVLEPDGIGEHGPTVIVEPTRGFMFYSELRQSAQSIAVAVHP